MLSKHTQLGHISRELSIIDEPDYLTSYELSIGQFLAKMHSKTLRLVKQKIYFHLHVLNLDISISMKTIDFLR